MAATTWGITGIAAATPMTASFFNQVINTVNGFTYDSTNKILEVNWWVKYSSSTLDCNSDNKWVVKYSWDAFYWCNSLLWKKLWN
mgnify:CR=1 FL=1